MEVGCNTPLRGDEGYMYKIDSLGRGKRDNYVIHSPRATICTVRSHVTNLTYWVFRYTDNNFVMFNCI